MAQLRPTLALLLPAALAIPQATPRMIQNLQTEGPPSAQVEQSNPSSTPRPDRAEANSKIESNLNDVLRGDPVLNGADLEANVDDVAITLSGSLRTEGQRRRALELAGRYASYRKVIDEMKLE